MSLIKELLKEINRCRKLTIVHDKIVLPSHFAQITRNIKIIKDAEKQIYKGDTIGMMKSYEELKKIFGSDLNENFTTNQ